MTTSDTAPPSTPEATASLGQGERDVAPEAAPTTMKNRKKKIAALVVLLLILAALFGWYLLNRKPLTQLPGLSSTKLPAPVMTTFMSTSAVESSE